MARKSKYSKQDLLELALNLVRENGIECLSTRTLSRKLGATQATIFTHYESMDDLKNEVLKEIRNIYNEYVRVGLDTNIPFKGFALALVKFARVEPEFTKILFMQSNKDNSLDDIMETEGHKAKIIKAASETFNISIEEASSLYRNLFIYVTGLESLIVSNRLEMTDEDISIMLGINARALVREIKNKDKDSRVGLMPTKNGEVPTFADPEYTK